MIGVKLFGSALVIISCMLFGISAKLRIKSRLENLRNLLSCIQIFENEIRYNISDIIHIIPKIKDVANSVNSKLFSGLIINDRRKSDIPLSKLWAQTVEESLKNSYYEKNDKEILVQFGNVLGCGDVDTQLKNLDFFRTNVSELITICEKKANKNGDLYSKVGMYVGAVIVILLI